VLVEHLPQDRGALRLLISETRIVHSPGGCWYEFGRIGRARLVRAAIASHDARVTSWNEERAPLYADPSAPPKEIPWRLFAAEVLLVLFIVGAGCLVSTLT
jgi:hypothetical protein